MLKKKIWSSFQRIKELFTQKFVTKLKKYGVGIRDPEKNLFRIRVQGQKGTGSRIRNTASSLSKLPLYLRRYVYGILPTFSIFFYVKIQLFVTAKPAQDPNSNWGQKLEPDLDPHWNLCGSALLVAPYKVFVLQQGQICKKKLDSPVSQLAGADEGLDFSNFIRTFEVAIHSHVDEQVANLRRPEITWTPLIPFVIRYEMSSLIKRSCNLDGV
jgi:hypothetical protein